MFEQIWKTALIVLLFPFLVIGILLAGLMEWVYGKIINI